MEFSRGNMRRSTRTEAYDKINCAAEFVRKTRVHTFTRSPTRTGEDETNPSTNLTHHGVSQMYSFSSENASCQG